MEETPDEAMKIVDNNRLQLVEEVNEESLQSDSKSPMPDVRMESLEDEEPQQVQTFGRAFEPRNEIKIVEHIEGSVSES